MICGWFNSFPLRFPFIYKGLSLNKDTKHQGSQNRHLRLFASIISDLHKKTETNRRQIERRQGSIHISIDLDGDVSCHISIDIDLIAIPLWRHLAHHPFAGVDAQPRALDVLRHVASLTINNSHSCHRLQYRVSILFFTGVCRAELEYLDWTQIDFEDGYIEIKAVEHKDNSTATHPYDQQPH
jgi:integrase